MQLYAQAPQGVLGKAKRVLAAFEKTRLLAQGETQLLTLEAPVAQLASYDDLGKIQKSAYVLEKGKYQFYLGTSVRETEQVFCFTMPEDTVTEQLTAKLVPTSLAERMLSDGSFEKLPQSEPNDPDYSAIKRVPREESDGFSPAVRALPGHQIWSQPYKKDAHIFMEVAEGKITLDEFVTQMTDEELEAIGAGDQGMMFGFASNETEEYMPYSAALAQKLSKQLTKVRKDGTLSYLRPDGKTQVTVEYDENNKPIRLDAIVVSSQHAPEVSQEQIHEDIKKYVIDAIVDPAMVDADTKIFINPTGRFVIGGPNGDSGLTGRKIIVDTYGGAARHGGGAFSGKDCTKVDRSAAYAARYVAKNLVAAGIADRCEIQLSYAIGVAHPTSICVDTFGTGKLSDEKIVEIIRENFDLRPNGIIKMLDLRRPIYKQTASYGHFGRTDLNLPWEKLDKVDALKKYL